MVVLLPLQPSWAAVSVYTHQTSVTADHPGHHAHQHPADAGGAGDSDPAKLGEGEPDCGACHAGCCLIPLDLTQMLPLFAAADDSFGQRAMSSTPPLDRPDRPNWLSHA